MNFKSICISLAFCAVPVAAFSASKSEIMLSRYIRHLTCMQRAFGQDEFNNKLGLVFVLNKWGISEPTGQSIADASEKVKIADAKCRADNNLEDEPRP